MLSSANWGYCNCMLVGSLNMFICKELFRSLVFLVEHFKIYICTEDKSFFLHIGGEFGV